MKAQIFLFSTMMLCATHAIAIALSIFAKDARLFVQGTKQALLERASVEPDVFVAESDGAEIDFERDAADKVSALTLKQRGQVLRASVANVPEHLQATALRTTRALT